MGTSFYEALRHDFAKKCQELKNVGHNDFELNGTHHELIITQVLGWIVLQGRNYRAPRGRLLFAEVHGLDIVTPPPAQHPRTEKSHSLQLAHQIAVTPRYDAT